MPPPLRRVVLASRNRGKLEELRRILAGLPVALVTAAEVGAPEVEETGESFEANALLKARAVAAATGEAALADDSGIAVDALGGAPGVRSARYAGDAASDADNLGKLVDAVRAIPEPERRARFECVAALALPDGRAWTTTGVMRGRVITEPRGDGGFGYDPMFVGDGETRTNAELPPDLKDARSHRGEAFRAMRPVVEQLLRAQ